MRAASTPRAKVAVTTSGLPERRSLRLPRIGERPFGPSRHRRIPAVGLHAERLVELDPTALERHTRAREIQAPYPCSVQAHLLDRLGPVGLEVVLPGRERPGV